MPHLVSTRLRADVSLYAAADGHVLRVGDDAHRVHLDPADADDLIHSLGAARAPLSGSAGAALDALVQAGLVDAPVPRVTVVGDGILASAVRAALRRSGIDEGDPVLVADTCLVGAFAWASGDRVLIAPPAVRAVDVDARHRAATRHLADPSTAPLPGGPAVSGPHLTGAGLELAAATVVAELVRPVRPPHEAVVVHLHSLVVSRHPVLPVPPAPR